MVRMVASCKAECRAYYCILTEKIRILHDTADDGSEGPWDYEGLIRFETYMKECRVAESGARTQIVVKVDLLN